MTIKKKKTKDKPEETTTARPRRRHKRRRTFEPFVRDRKVEVSIRGHASVEVDGEEIAELGARAWVSMPRPSPGFFEDFAEVMMPILSSMLPGMNVSPPGEHHPPIAPPDFGGPGDPEFCGVARRLDTQEVGTHPYVAPELLAPCVHLVGHLGSHRFETWDIRKAVGAEIFGRKKAASL